MDVQGRANAATRFSHDFVLGWQWQLRRKHLLPLGVGVCCAAGVDVESLARRSPSRRKGPHVAGHRIDVLTVRYLILLMGL